MGNDYTEEQKKVIYTKGKNILVSAAAGSGKTAVLVERIINKITSLQEPVSIDRLLVVTFTEAAAGEMRQRVGTELTSLLEKDTENPLLHRQFSLLSKAAICTIHSFCLRVVKRYFYAIDLDPVFKIADVTEMKILKTEILKEILEDEYAIKDNQAFFNVVDSYGGGKTKDNAFFELILGIHAFIQNMPWPKDWLDEKIQLFNIEEQCDIEDTIWYESAKKSIIESLEGVLESIYYAKQLCIKPMGPVKYLDTLEKDKELTENIISALNKGYDNVYCVLKENIFGRLSTITQKDQVDEGLKNQVKDIRDNEIKATIKNIEHQFFLKPSLEAVSEIKMLYKILYTLKNIVIKFSHEFKKEKQRRNIVDFNDLEHFCLNILLERKIEGDNVTYEPTLAAYELREYYEEVMTDEYQDSNTIQEWILSSIAGKDNANRLMVGDIKQSIYRFRGANPNIFLEKYLSFTTNENSKNVRIDLSKNFRSRVEILETVNFLFFQLMSEKTCKISYDEKSCLYAAGQFPSYDYDVFNTEILIGNLDNKSLKDYELKEQDIENEDEEIIEELSKTEVEAQIIATKIMEIVKGENDLRIWDKSSQSYRLPEFRDIVILARSVKDIGNIFYQTFIKYDIPLHAGKSGNYFDAIEVDTALGFLQIIDNPRQDIHILTVLRSPVYMMDSDELLDIRGVKEGGDYYSCIIEYLQKSKDTTHDVYTDSDTVMKLELFMKNLKNWREMAIFTPISRIIGHIYEETGYLNYAGVMPGGELRQANLRALLDRAIKYEETKKGLFHFIKYIERLKTLSGETDEAKISSENENIVRMMTIHRSKGLEFPIVFVSMLGKTFNTLDERGQVLLHQNMGFGPYFVDLDNRIKTKTLPRQILAEKIYRENIDEEMRMLYVALTRAKEKLILTGCVKSIENSMLKWERYKSKKETFFDPHFIYKSKTFLDWIMTAVARHRSTANIMGDEGEKGDIFLYDYPVKINIKITTKDDLKQVDNFKTAKFDYIYENMKKIVSKEYIVDDIKMLQKKFAWKYPFEAEKELPTKISISEIKRIHQREMIDAYTQINIYEKPINSTPKFLQGQKPFTIGEIGTINHTVMEHLDIKKAINYNDVKELVEILVCKNIISKEEGQAAEIEKISRFLTSPLANRMRNSEEIMKEVPFVMSLSPYEVYGKEDLACSSDNILVHGIIDCYFKEDEHYVIVDYKSDLVPSVQVVAKKYALQLELYKKAVEKSHGIVVKECVLYLFAIGETVTL